MTPLGLTDQELLEMKIVDWGYTEELRPHSWSHYESWVNKELHGGLNYLTDDRKELRKDLRSVYPDARCALVFLFDYTLEKQRLLKERPALKLASYVSGFEGVDYHYWIKEKLGHIQARLEHRFEGLECFYSIDAQPVLERDLAYRAGLGWFGKNSMLISKKHGSYTILASMLLNQKLSGMPRSVAATDHCGNCTACIDHCPTKAIVADRVIDAKKCISNFTIEQFRPIQAPEGFPTESAEIFGCDICQEVCPWNRKPLTRALETKESAAERNDLVSFFNRAPSVLIEELEALSNRQYRKRFKATALERTGRVGMLKNLRTLIRS